MTTSHHSVSTESRGRLERFLRPDKPRFMLPVTGLWILALDWLLFSSNVVTAGTATPVVMLAGFLFGAVGAYLLQLRLAEDARHMSALKALIAGTAVGVPWPVGGTVIGGWILLASGLGKSRKGLAGHGDKTTS